MEKQELMSKALDKADDVLNSVANLLDSIKDVEVNRIQEGKITDAMIDVVAKVSTYKAVRSLTE